MTDMRVNGDRLWSSIDETARFGGTAAGGVSRLTLSDEDREVRDWFVNACNSLGCDVWFDEVGNIFARRPGRDDSLNPIAMGSHLDTQPAGGRFDGVAGVMAGLEVLRTLNEYGYQTRAPLELVDWTNEEGSRFPPTMIASGVFAGIYTAEYAWANTDRQGLTFGDELRRIGYRGKRRAGDHTFSGYFELHIEQGPILFENDITIGVVTGAQGQMWYDVAVTGRQGHAGTMPMLLRRDPVSTFARMAEGVRAIALDHGPDGVATIGQVDVRPNSRNVIPGSVLFTIDIRHPDALYLGEMHEELLALADLLRAETGTDVEVQNVLSMPPMEFDPLCVETVRQAAMRLGYSNRDIVSGPGHDALNVARVAPAAMIFIPCGEGISHAESEHASQADVTAGANVLIETVLDYDSSLEPAG